MPLQSTRYAEMLAGRMSIELTRALLESALNGTLARSGFTPHPVFKVLVPHHCDCAADDVLDPRASWADKDAYDESARALARMFRENFAHYEAHVAPEVLAAGPDPEAAGPATTAPA